MSDAKNSHIRPCTPRHSVCSSSSLITSAFRAHHLGHIRNQMASMLHALSSTFTTCACGSKAKNRALNFMAAFIDGCLPIPAPLLPQCPNNLSSMDMRSRQLDLGSLVGVRRGFHTPEKSPLNGGIIGIKMIPDQFAGPSD